MLTKFKKNALNSDKFVAEGGDASNTALNLSTDGDEIK
jgi:hypothetical protein